MDWRKGSILPLDRAVFLQEPFKRRATRLYAISMIENRFGEILSLTPPLSQIRISSQACGFSVGTNQKYSSLVSFASDEIGRSPA